MKKLIAAILLSVALPAVAHAQSAPAPAPKEDCCDKMKAEGKECCCKDMAKDGHAEHSMHDKSDSSNEHAH